MLKMFLFLPIPRQFKGIEIPDEFVGMTLEEIRADRDLFVKFLEVLYERFDNFG